MKTAAEDADLRVMSFNIRNGRSNDGENRWENRRQLVIDLIREQHPDLLGTQEAYRDQLDELLLALPEYGEIGVGREDGKREGEHSQILFRRDRLRVLDQGGFWFSSMPEVPGSASWGNRITRLCTWARLHDLRAARPLYFYNLHLDHESQLSREESARLLLERIRERRHPDPVIVAGDFNAEEDNPAMRMLATSHEPVLRDTFRAVHPDVVAAATFHGFHGGAEGERIDFILTSQELQVRDADILRDTPNGRHVSDHYPTTTRLAFTPTPVV